MADALWIDETYLLENSPISEDTDLKLITPNIIYCQDVYLKPLLGSNLFSVIEAQINAQTYTSRITTLLDDHIKKVLMNYVISESIPDLKFRITNKGLQEKNSENSNTSEFEQMKFMTERYRNRAEVFGQRLTNFLIENDTTYPEYRNGNTGVDDILPKNSSYSTGIYLGDDEDNCKDRFYR